MRRLLLLVSALLLSSLAGPGLWPGHLTARAQSPAAEISTGLVFECLPENTIRAHFLWTSSGQGEQWVDLSLFDNGFAPGTFLGAGPLPPGQYTFVWDGLIPNATHYVRVNTLTAEGWAPSQTLIFSTPGDCPFPVEPQPQAPTTVNCPDLSLTRLSGCVWTLKPDFAAYAIGEIVNYCYFVSQPTNIRIVATKPDGTSLVIVDGYVSGPGACIGPYQANVPLGMRTVQIFGGPDMRLLAQTHFFVQ
jgi:hypothetical protein